MAAIERNCSCGVAYDDKAWDALPGARNGREGELSPGLLLEYRNCPCGQTMARDPLPPVLSLLHTEAA